MSATGPFAAPFASLLATCLFQAAVSWLILFTYTPATEPVVPYAAAASYLVLGCLHTGVAVARGRFRPSMFGMLTALWLLCTGTVTVSFAVLKEVDVFFPDRLEETLTWPDLEDVEVFLYADSFREKIVTVKVRRGWFPVMTEEASCLRTSHPFSAARRGDELVLRCEGAERRIALRPKPRDTSLDAPLRPSTGG